MGMPNKRNYFNVTVVDRDVRAAFCGGKAALVFCRKGRDYFEKYQNSIDEGQIEFYNSI